MPLFSFFPISPGENNNKVGSLTNPQSNAIPWILIIVGVAILLFSIFSKTRRRWIYLLISFILIILGVLFVVL